MERRRRRAHFFSICITDLPELGREGLGLKISLAWRWKVSGKRGWVIFYGDVGKECRLERCRKVWRSNEKGYASGVWFKLQTLVRFLRNVP